MPSYSDMFESLGQDEAGEEIRIGRYRIQRPLGTGAFSTVYLAVMVFILGFTIASVISRTMFLLSSKKRMRG